MFQLLTDAAIRAIFRAHEAARLMGFDFVDGVHFLIAATGDEKSISRTVLEQHGLNLNSVKAKIKPLMVATNKGPTNTEIVLGPSGSALMTVAWTASKSSRSILHTGHILLGLLEDQIISEQVFIPLQIDLQSLREAVSRLSNDPEAILNEDREAPELSLPETISKRLSRDSDLILLFAEREARRFGQPFIGIEHILIGLLDQRAGTAAQTQTNDLKLLESVRKQAISALTQGNGWVPRRIQYAPAALHVLDQADQLSAKLNSPFIEPQHIHQSIATQDRCAADILRHFE